MIKILTFLFCFYKDYLQSSWGSLKFQLSCFRAVNQWVPVAWTACSSVINQLGPSTILSANKPNLWSPCRNSSMRSVLCLSFATSSWRRFRIYAKNWRHLLPTRWHHITITRPTSRYRYEPVNGRQVSGYGRKSGVKMRRAAVRRWETSPFRIPGSVPRLPVRKRTALLLRRHRIPLLQQVRYFTYRKVFIPLYGILRNELKVFRWVF